jgi:hypothetical protein
MKKPPGGAAGWLGGGAVVSGGLQISPAGVRAVAVFRNHVCGWPRAGHVENGKPVLEVRSTRDGDLTRPADMVRTGNVANADSVGESYAPAKQAGLSVVAQ